MPFDINQLRTYSVNNDRVGYWNYLGQFDRYGQLAAGVATGETSSGYIANRYLSASYEQAAGIPMTADLQRNIGSDLMRRDLVAREAAIQDGGSGLALSPRVIADYHGASFSAQTNGIVGKEGWTAWAPLRDAIENNDGARADRIWGRMLQDDNWGRGTIAANTLSDVALHR